MGRYVYRAPPKPRPFLNVSNDFKFISDEYKKRFGGPFYSVEPNTALVYCTNSGCKASFNPHTGLWSSGCSGVCII